MSFYFERALTLKCFFTPHFIFSVYNFVDIAHSVEDEFSDKLLYDRQNSIYGSFFSFCHMGDFNLHLKMIIIYMVVFGRYGRYIIIPYVYNNKPYVLFNHAILLIPHTV